MLSSGAETLLRMVGWTFLPDIGARMLFRVYTTALLQLPPKFGYKSIQPPTPGTQAFATQKKICFSIVIAGYLIWTSLQAYIGAPENFYQLLGVMPDAGDATLKTAFRNFARYNHPDRVGQQGEARFIAARDAFDTLKSSTKRYAYDRFGPDVVKWVADCTTISDYIEKGLLASCGFYIVSAVAMVLYAIFGQSGFGAFWRYNLFFTLISLELLLVLSPQFYILTYLFPARVPYQHVRLLHQVFISLTIAITRIGPAVFPSISGNSTSKEGWEQERSAMYSVVKHVTEIVARMDREISRMINMELTAIHGGDEETVQTGDEAAKAASTGTQVANLDLTLKRRRVSIGPSSAAETPGISQGPLGAPSGAVELDDNLMRTLTREVEEMVIEKNLKRHPMLARIWKEGVDAGRRAYQREREDRLFGLLSQTTAVEASQKGIHDMDDTSKRDYVDRRARSEGFSTPSPRSSPSLTTPNAAHSHTYSHSQPITQTEGQPQKPTLNGGPRNPSFPRPGSELAKKVEAERARIREARLDRLAMSPPEFQTPTSPPVLGNTRNPLNRLSFISTLSGDVPGSPGSIGSPSPSARLSSIGSIGSTGLHTDGNGGGGSVSGGEHSASPLGRMGIRSRSVSLVN